MRFVVAFVLVLSCVFSSLKSARVSRFDRAIIFGDSQSDNGNVYRLTNRTYPIVPPYYEGRFSNDRNWVDLLAISEKSNYAYGGATTDANYVQGYTKLSTVPVPGVRQQVASYVQNVSLNKPDFNRTVYIVWVGGGDLLLSMNATTQGYVSSMLNSVRDLIAFGARNLLIFNQAPFYVFPYISRMNMTAQFTALIDDVNNKLTTDLDTMQRMYSNVTLQRYDVHSFLTKIVANQSYPFADTTSPCWTTYNLTTVNQGCADPKKFAFLDNFYLASTVHKLLADDVFALLSYNRAPLKSASLAPVLLALFIALF